MKMNATSQNFELSGGQNRENECDLAPFLGRAAGKIVKMSTTAHNFEPGGRQDRENERDLAQLWAQRQTK